MKFFCFLVMVGLLPCSLFAQDVASNRNSEYSNLVYKTDKKLTSIKASIPGQNMRKVGRGLAIGGAGLTLIGILLISSADELYYTQTIGPGGVIEEGDPKGPIGVGLTVTGIGMGITGIVLWTKGNKKYKRHLERQAAFLKISPNRIGVRYAF
jgi:hypothetical protein